MARQPLAYLLLVLVFVLAACGEDDAELGVSPSPTGEPGATPTLDSQAGRVETIPPPTTEAGLTPTADVPDDGLQLAAMPCCGVHGEVNGENYLFVMTLGGGEQSGHGMLHAVRVDGSGSVEIVGSIETPLALTFDSLTGTSRIAFADNVVYLPIPGQEASGLWVVDVSDPASPEQLALAETEHLPISVAVSGDLAAVAVREFTGPALFFDISDPTNPQQVSEGDYSVASMPPAIVFEDSLLYITDRSGVTIIDATTPDAPGEPVEFPNPDWDGPPTGGGSGILDPLDGVARPDSFLDVAVSGQRLYIAASDAGLRVVDVSDPANPEETFQAELPGRVINVSASHDRVYAIAVDIEDGNPPFVYSLYTLHLSETGDPQSTGTSSEDRFESMVPLQGIVLGDDTLYLFNPSTVHVLKPAEIDRPPMSATPEPVETPTRAAAPEETQGIQTPDDSGTCVAFTIEEAQAMAAFPLMMPAEMPGWLELEVFLLRHDQPNGDVQEPESCEGATQVDTFFAATMADGQRISLILIQTTTEPDYSEFPSEEMTVPGKDVTRYTPDETSEKQPDFYAWQSGEAWCALIVPEGSPLEEADLLSLLESMR